MNSAIFKIVIAIIFITIFIYVVKKLKYILKIIEKYKNKKIIKYIFFIIFTLIIIFFAKCIYSKIIVIRDSIELYQISKKDDLMFSEYDKKILEEIHFYQDIMNQNFENQKYSEPYIPEGFSYVEGSWNNGFVIQDNSQNQYVWVPCTNKDYLNIEKLQRINFSHKTLISKDLCNNENYKKFLQSALENGGFYISRFEIGKEDNYPVSKKNVEIWKDVTNDEAKKIIDTMYDNINCELMNGYAYDTTISWLMNTNELKVNIIDVEGKDKFYTGKMSYNNIYDFTDNIMELTSEIYYSLVVIRGFPYEITQDYKQSVLQQLGYIIEDVERFCIIDTENCFLTSTVLGFRTILYK